jgi:hypothetical protein
MRVIGRWFVILMVLVHGGFAVAQEVPAEDTGSTETTDVATTAESTIPGRAIGIGAGWEFPTDIQVPTLASVRFRLASGLTAEILAHLGYTTTSSGPEDAEDTVSEFEATAAALIRLPLATSGRLQLALLLGAGLGFTTTSNDPDGDDNTTTTNTFAAAGVWGLGIDWFFKSNWSLSLSATNPAVTLLSSTTDPPGMGPDISSTAFEIAAIFDPTVTAMVHLYFE